MSINPYWNTGSQAAQDAVLGAGVGSIIPGVGTAVGGVVGGALGLGKGIYDNFFANQGPSSTPPGGDYSASLGQFSNMNNARGQYAQAQGNGIADTLAGYAPQLNQEAANNRYNAGVTGANLRDIGAQQYGQYQQNYGTIAGQANPFDPNSANFKGLVNQQMNNIDQQNQQRQMQMAVQNRGGMGFGASNAMNNDAALAKAQAQNALLAQNYQNQGNWMNQHDQALIGAQNSANGQGAYGEAGQLYNGLAGQAGSLGAQYGLGAQDYYGNQANSAYGMQLGANQYGLNNQNAQTSGLMSAAGSVAGYALDHPDMVGKLAGYTQGAYNNVFGGGSQTPTPSAGTVYSGYTPMG